MAQRMQQVTDLFTASRTRDFDMFLLTGYADGRASRRAIAFIAEESQSRE
ncbi:MAG: hypothetical protein NTZ50_11245 [Chloroflexi bacterium]|nr:hypothetical protein [Chloroflexota bacterium]